MLQKMMRTMTAVVVVNYVLTVMKIYRKVWHMSFEHVPLLYAFA
jgi:hypothetical protein